MQVVFKVELFDLSTCCGVRPKPEEQINVTIDGFTIALDLLEGLGKTATFLVDNTMAKHCTAIIQRAEIQGSKVEIIEGEKIKNVKYLWWHKLPLDLYILLYNRFLSKNTLPVWILTDTIYNKPYGLPSIVSSLAGENMIKRVAKTLIN